MILLKFCFVPLYLLFWCVLNLKDVGFGADKWIFLWNLLWVFLVKLGGKQIGFWDKRLNPEVLALAWGCGLWFHVGFSLSQGKKEIWDNLSCILALNIPFCQDCSILLCSCCLTLSCTQHSIWISWEGIVLMGLCYSWCFCIKKSCSMLATVQCSLHPYNRVSFSSMNSWKSPMLFDPPPTNQVWTFFHVVNDF